MLPGLVVPSAIPWARLKGRDLEECLYWLVDALGGKDLQWRLGGTGGGAADQGRDLEAYFYMPTPADGMTREKWWIEAKGRTKTVPPDVVKATVHDAAGHADLDCLVIATNTTFSNPTRNWLETWQRSHPRPKVHLWDKDTLEKLLSSRPDVVVRLFAEALSRQGQLEVVRSRFWNYSAYADTPALESLWRDAESLEWDPVSRLAVIASEAVNGRLDLRPWASALTEDDLFDTLGVGLVNLPYFFGRAYRAGVEEEPYLQALAYLIVTALSRNDTRSLPVFMREVWDHVEGKRIPDELRAQVLKPVLEQIQRELRDVCTSDCARVTTDPIELHPAEIDRYWLRLRARAEAKADEAKQRPHSVIIIENPKKPCAVGFALTPEQGCPLIALHGKADTMAAHLDETFVMLREVVQKRGLSVKAS
jgi:hypothetical protein